MLISCSTFQKEEKEHMWVKYLIYADLSWFQTFRNLCVVNIFRAFPRTLEIIWRVTGHPGWVLGHIQRSCTRTIMFLTMFYSHPCSKSILGKFAQVVEKMKYSLVTTRKNMDLSVKCAYVLVWEPVSKQKRLLVLCQKQCFKFRKHFFFTKIPLFTI